MKVDALFTIAFLQHLPVVEIPNPDTSSSLQHCCPLEPSWHWISVTDSPKITHPPTGGVWSLNIFFKAPLTIHVAPEDPGTSYINSDFSQLAPGTQMRCSYVPALDPKISTACPMSYNHSRDFVDQNNVIESAARPLKKIEITYLSYLSLYNDYHNYLSICRFGGRFGKTELPCFGEVPDPLHWLVLA